MKFILIFLFSACLGFSLVAVIYFAILSTNKPSILTKDSLFSINKAPGNTINGKIIYLTGGVGWQSREATQASLVKIPDFIQQGERIVTDASGSATLHFTNMSKIVVLPDSDLDFIQTLPNNLVVAQNSGSVQYYREGRIPVSIRALHLLIDQDLGDIKVSVNKEDKVVIVKVNKGKVRMGFNDLNLISKLVILNEGKKLLFHDDTRETEIQ